jgi:hypothetical protein
MTNRWSDEELAELGPGLRAFVEASPPRGRGFGTCSICGERFRKLRGPRAKHCGVCRLSLRRKKERERVAQRRGVSAAAPLVARKCDVCGGRYRPKRVWQRYCSPACSVRAHRRRLAERQAGAAQ